jgi:hypothetical protein
MNQVVSSPLIYEYLRLDFKVSRSLIETAIIDADEARITIAKVMCYSLVAFALIAMFEAIVINGTRLALNTGIWVLNTSNSILFKSSVPEVLEPPPILVQDGPAAEQILDEPMPPLLQAEEEEFQKVFEILAMSNVFQLAYHRSYLVDFRERTKHIHPLQVMGCMLEKNSKQRKHAAEFIDRRFVGSTFIEDTLAGFDNPLHAGNTAKYIVSFAEKADIPADAVRGFLSQNSPHLKNLIHYILRDD